MKRKRRKRNRAAGTFDKFMVADPPCPSSFLKEMGYVYLKNKIPRSICKDLKQCIKADVDKLIERTGVQEQPLEFMSEETAQKMEALEKYIVKNLLKPTFNKRARVPSTWSETAYGRVKKQNSYTGPHCDALNTILERQLLKDVSDLEGFSKSIDWSSGNPIETVLTSMPYAPIEECLPIYTIWVPLHNLCTFDASHLRVEPLSQLFYDIHVKRHKTTNCPTKVRSSDSNLHFLSPEEPYGAGDVVIFHCLTQHDASCHKPGKGKTNCGMGDRVSFDMRVLMDIATKEVDGIHGGRCVCI